MGTIWRVDYKEPRGEAVGLPAIAGVMRDDADWIRS